MNIAEYNGALDILEEYKCDCVDLGDQVQIMHNVYVQRCLLIIKKKELTLKRVKKLIRDRKITKVKRKGYRDDEPYYG